MFCNQKHSATPFAADCEALHKAQEHQQDRRHDADRLVGGQAAHEEGGNTHKDDRQLQQLLTAELVAEVAEHNAADGAGDEADRVGHERCENRGERVV